MPRRNSFASRVKSRRNAQPAPSTPVAAPHRPASASDAGAATTAASAPTAAAKPQQDPDEGYVAVGRVLGPFGLKGELRVQALTDNPVRFAAKARVFAGLQPVTIAASREAQGHLYVKLKGFRDRASTEKFRHALLQVPEAALPPLPDGEYYRFQLVGLEVVARDGAALGTLDEIIETGANDVYRVRAADGTDALLPALADVIVSINLAAKRMVVDPPEWR